MTEETNEYPTAHRSYADNHSKPQELPKEVQGYAYLKLAVSEIGGCLTDIGIVLAQGTRPDNEAKRGGIAAGLRRAASYVAGAAFDPGPPTKVLPITAAELKASLEQESRELKTVDHASIDADGNVSLALISEPILSGAEAIEKLEESGGV